MRVVECEYQYFLLTIKSLIPSDATLDKVLELTVTRKRKRHLRIFNRDKSKMLVISSFAQKNKKKGT